LQGNLANWKILFGKSSLGKLILIKLYTHVRRVNLVDKFRNLQSKREKESETISYVERILFFSVKIKNSKLFQISKNVLYKSFILTIKIALFNHIKIFNHIIKIIFFRFLKKNIFQKLFLSKIFFKILLNRRVISIRLL